MKVHDTNHVADFHDLCPRLYPRGSFGESRRNGIWAYTCRSADRKHWPRDIISRPAVLPIAHIHACLLPTHFIN